MESFSGPESNSFSGPESGRMEQLLAQIGARIKQLFGARIRDPKENRGPNRTTFVARGSWLWMFLWGLFGGHCFNLHICVHQPSFRSSNGIRLFGARIRDPNGTAFRGPNRGPNRGGPESTFRGPEGLLDVDCFNLHICVHQASFRRPRRFNPGPEWNSISGPECRTTFRPSSWLWMFFQGLFGGHGFNRLFGARIRDPNGTAFRGPNRGPNRTTFRGPGLLAVDVPPGALWRPPFQSAHLCPPAIFSGPEWNDFLGPEPSARMVVFFLWCLNTLCKLDFFVFWGSKA